MKALLSASPSPETSAYVCVSPESASEVLKVATAEPLAIFSSKLNADIKTFAGPSLIPITLRVTSLSRIRPPESLLSRRIE